MIDFVGTSPFLRIAEWVAVEIMHFQTTHNIIIFRTIFSHEEVPNLQFVNNAKLSWVHGRFN